MDNLTKEEIKRNKIKEYKKSEYLKNAEKIKARQREYYYKKKIELGIPDKKDKYKITILRIEECEDKSRFTVHFN
jgi:hypothetical protein